MKLNVRLFAATVLATVFATSVAVAPLYAMTSGSPAMAGYAQDRRWDEPPGEFQEMERRGFHDGVEGARRDYGNHRRPDVNNRDEYRNPHLRGRDREPYRRGFERGYRVGVEHFYNGR